MSNVHDKQQAFVASLTIYPFNNIMDWNNYRSYINPFISNVFCSINNESTTSGFRFEDNEDNVVADVTDSYKELESVRIENE